MNVSVIIPTHNRVGGATRAVESVLNQTVLPKEIIVVDDYSDVPAKVDAKSDDVEIIVHRFSENKGACAARNKGVELSSGDVLMFLDDDDTWKPDKIKNQLHIFDNNPDVGLVYSARSVVYDDDRETEAYQITPNPNMQGDIYSDIFYANHIGTTSSVAIKRDIFDKAGGFDINLPCLQDYDLWIRCTKITKVDFDPNPTVVYEVSRTGKSQISSSGDKHPRAVAYMLNKYKKEIDSLGVTNKRKVHSNFYFYVAKAKHRKRYIQSISWSLKSFFKYPNVKAVALLMPPTILNKLRKG